MNNNAFRPEAASATALGRVFGSIQERLGGLDLPPPADLVGDVLYALSTPHLRKSEATTSYATFMHKLTLTQRWRLLGELIGRRTLRAGPESDRERVLDFLTGLLCGRLMRMVLIAHGAELRRSADALPLLKDCYEEDLVEGDYAKRLLDDFPFVMVGLVRRARTEFSHLDSVIDIPLVHYCLAIRWDPHTYEPRQLREITLPGDEDEALPGDHWGIRGVTKKIREDQIPKVLPSEFVTWKWGQDSQGRIFTLHKIINGSPTCYQHYDTRRPVIRHRVLICFVLAVEEREATRLGVSPGDSDSDELPPATQADLLGKPLAFELLVNAAQKMPHENISADVAWFERRGPRCRGTAFPLRSLAVTRTKEDSWHNAVAVDRLLPDFFVRTAAAINRDFRPEVTLLTAEPKDYLNRALAGRSYEAVFVIGVAREKELRNCLPSSGVVLPRFARDVPTVLAVCADDGRSQLRGEGFADLLTAHIAPLPLPEVDGSALVQEFLEMIIGGVKELALVPVALE